MQLIRGLKETMPNWHAWRCPAWRLRWRRAAPSQPHGRLADDFVFVARSEHAYDVQLPVGAMGGF